MPTKTDIWMPLYVADYLADTTRLTTEQHGAYLLILMDYWRNGPPPDDDMILSQITHLSSEKWASSRKIIQPMFYVASGVWRHKRVEFELRKARGNKERAAVAAAARWGKPKTDAQTMPDGMPESCPTDAQVNAQTMLDGCSTDAQVNAQTMPDGCSSPSPSPSPSHPHPSSSSQPFGGKEIQGFTKGFGAGRAGRLPPVGEVQKHFDAMDPEALRALPGSCVQSACILVGIHRTTAARAVQRRDLTPAIFIREYENVLVAEGLDDALKVLVKRLGLKNGTTKARGR